MRVGLWSGGASLTPVCRCCRMRLPHSQHRTQERSSSSSQPLLDFPPWINPDSNLPLTPQGMLEVSFPEENGPELWFLFVYRKEAKKNFVFYIGVNKEISGFPFFTSYIMIKLFHITSAALLTGMLALSYQGISQQPGGNGKFEK